MKTNKNKKQTKGKAPATKKPTAKPATAKKPVAAAVTAKANPTTKREIKVGDKIVGQSNGAVGIVKTIKTDNNFGGRKPRTYAIIDIQNPKKGQSKSTVADISYLQQQAKRGGVKITTPRKAASKPTATVQSKAIKKATAKQPAEKANKQQGKKQGEGAKPSHPQGSKQSHVGEIHRGNTKYIDTEPKPQRDYAVVKDNDGKVTVAKVQSIKQFDENGKNADEHLVEIKHENYGLSERSGVDDETFSKNRMSNKPLRLEDKDVFPEQQPKAKLNSKDKHNVLIHTGQINDPKKKKK